MNLCDSPDLRSIVCSLCVILLSFTKDFSQEDKATHNLIYLSRVLKQRSLNRTEPHNNIPLGM